MSCCRGNGMNVREVAAKASHLTPDTDREKRVSSTLGRKSLAPFTSFLNGLIFSRGKESNGTAGF